MAAISKKKELKNELIFEGREGGREDNQNDKKRI